MFNNNNNSIILLTLVNILFNLIKNYFCILKLLKYIKVMVLFLIDEYNFYSAIH